MRFFSSISWQKAALTSVLSIPMLAACSAEHATTTEHTQSETTSIQYGRVTLSISGLRDTTRFKKNVCELIFTAANGLDEDVALAVDNYERMAHEPLETGGFGAIYVSAKSQGDYPLPVDGNCQQDFSYKIRSIKCRLGEPDTGGDCLDKVDISPEGAVVLIDSTFR